MKDQYKTDLFKLIRRLRTEKNGLDRLIEEITVRELSSGNMVPARMYVFVLMPFAEEFRDIYELGIKATAIKLQLHCERVDEIEFNDAILAEVYKGIRLADVVIADLTGRNPNVFYEVGYAHALEKSVILLTQKVEDIPFDLKGHNHIVYANIRVLRQRLEKRLRSVCLTLAKPA